MLRGLNALEMVSVVIDGIEKGAAPFKTGTVNNNGDSGGDAPSILSIAK